MRSADRAVEPSSTTMTRSRKKSKPTRNGGSRSRPGPCCGRERLPEPFGVAMRGTGRRSSAWPQGAWTWMVNKILQNATFMCFCSDEDARLGPGREWAQRVFLPATRGVVKGWLCPFGVISVPRYASCLEAPRTIPLSHGKPGESRRRKATRLRQVGAHAPDATPVGPPVGQHA